MLVINKTGLAVYLLLISTLFSEFAVGIVMRHDVGDDQYLGLARELPKPVLLSRASDGRPNGYGIYISEHMILTAAHVAQSLLVPGKILPGTGTAKVKSIHTHPDWFAGKNDMAIVKLFSKQSHVNVVELCQNRLIENEWVYLIGGGDSGTGLTGPVSNDGKIRAAINQIDKAKGGNLYFDFSYPNEALQLEGISGPGDSGSPAFLKMDDDSYCAVGVSSAQLTVNSNTQEGTYGVTEIYTSVLPNINWIKEVSTNEH